MELFDLTLWLAVAMLVIAPLAARRSGRRGARASVFAIFLLLVINVYLAWHQDDALGTTLEGDAAAWALIFSFVAFFGGLISLAVSTAAFRLLSDAPRAKELGE